MLGSCEVRNLLVKRGDRLKQAVIEAVDEGLLTLGESGREAVYFHLQSLCSLKKEDVPDKPEAFDEALRKIFGVGAEVIERSVVKKLYPKLGIDYIEKKNYGFANYISEAGQMINT
jgi:hypothetical protein